MELCFLVDVLSAFVVATCLTLVDDVDEAVTDDVVVVDVTSEEEEPE